MKYLDVRIDLGAETGGDARTSVQALQGRLAAVQDRIKETADEFSPQDQDARAQLLLEESALLVELKRMAEAWDSARTAFDMLMARKEWELAGKACEILFRTGLEDALPALGQGIWLSVTFPVNPELTVALLNHVMEETPDHADGAAVAAATAVYVVDLRAEGKIYDELSVYTRQMLTTVARRHSGVEDQSDLDEWATRMDLIEPKNFLRHLRRVVDTLVEDNWWFDPAALQAELPDQ